MALRKRSLTLRGHRTSITLEDEFWEALQKIAKAKKRSVQELVTEIDQGRAGNLSSALRVYILTHINS
jgi:predicted DNA-binding ribbon-helix-helix protein